MGASVFILAGAVALIVAAWQGWQTAQFVGRAVAVSGRVVAAPGQAGSETSAHPTIEFAGPGGAPVRYRQNGMGARRVGSTVPVLYDPAAPAETAVVAGFWTQWFPVLAPLILGLAFLAIPLFGIEIGPRGARP